ncbi:alcohol dehydrogenase catalytic domain-containing protein [Rhodococcus sp. T2V]|uniref:alcohol dehydrogenase catalytic domain-containing protein n=1 Tax=Rhodococcus sp. T2V TaxID=3034164 RepID=UPI0023E0BE66|nr:alcohol dehydrogenase catalytic domain-containing protein [Rhodococcus sp. T2V]MDF3310567.1 alcohol dehydrogenase catalytic domain-containing protein [Rhodococcus sp. T2V]
MTGRTMRAARLHEVGEPMVLEDVLLPTPSVGEVVVRVRACGIVPNLANVLANWGVWFPQNPLPTLPSIFGLDPAGVIEEVGSDVTAFKPGDRVYVNPGRYCNECLACRRGDHINCDSFAFTGYFGFTATSRRMLDRYPYGGLAEYMLAPQYSLVKLPDSISFEHAARLGYLGTGYSALRKANVGSNQTVLINGISGTLGLGVALFALAMGATRILGTGRNRELLDRVRALAPGRIEVHSMLDGPVDEWVHTITERGVDAYVDALGPGAPPESMQQAIKALRRGGIAVNVGATAGMVPLDVHHMMDNQLKLEGSLWFTAAEGQEMISIIDSGLVDLSIFENVVSPLEKVNDAISGISVRNGGFSNFVVVPESN